MYFKKLTQRFAEFIVSNGLIFLITYVTMRIAQTRLLLPGNIIVGLTTTCLAILFQYWVISLGVELSAKYLYKNIPSYNQNLRPSYSFRSQFIGHLKYALRWTIPISGYYLFWTQTFITIDRLPTLADLPLLALKVQCALIFADLFYWAWHALQHKSRFLYKYTNHRYHHNYRFPVASHGTWLGTLDLFISTQLIGSKNILMVVLLFGHITEFEFCLILSYVHLMNCVDHCGKKVPFWSGFPLFPPLGYLFKFDQSIPIHEAHHNNNRYSYGLLGVADRLFGTARYPKVYDKVPKIVQVKEEVA